MIMDGDKSRDGLTQRILDLTLEMIFLLTGEDHVVVKIHERDNSSYQIPGGYCRTQSFNMEPPPHSGIHVRNNEKILELTHRILRLLTREVPLRCEDVTVHLSMEEWEYVERHKELYKDVMLEDHRPFITADKSGEFRAPFFSPNTRTEHIINNVEKYLNTARQGQAESTTYTEEKILAFEEGHVSAREIYPPTEHLLPDIKAEPASCEEGNLTDRDIYKPKEHTQTEHHYTHIWTESDSHKNILDPDTSAHLELTQTVYPSNDIKVESPTCEEGNLTERDVYKPPEHTQTEHNYTHIWTESDSHRNILDPDTSPHLELTQTVYPSNDIKEESPTCEEGNLTDRDVYEHTQTQCAVDNLSELEGKTNPVGINPNESLIKSRNPDQSIYYPDPVTNNSIYKGNLAPSSEIVTVSYSESDLVINETNCREEPPFSSTDCLENFTPASALKHQQVDTEEQPFSCPECEEHFTDSIALKKHQKIHKGKKLFKCSECGKCLYCSSNLARHRRIHTGENPFKCNECGKCFKCSSNLAIHKRTHTGEKPYTCTECGKCFKCSSNLAAHKWIHTGVKLYKCSECAISFVNGSDLAAHKRIHTGEKPYKCNECGKSFTSSSHLAAHKWIHTGEKPFKCSECGKSFVRCSDLNVHKRIHTGEKPYTCPECGKCFTRFSRLTAHKWIHKEERPYKCTECRKSFCQAADLVRHNRIHTGEKPFKCTECGKCFTQAAALACHNRLHTGEKPFKCTECGECFIQPARLATHKLIHSGEKPFTCTECGKSFAHASAFNIHNRIHTGEKPYKCIDCEKCFARTSALARHKKIHTG